MEDSITPPQSGTLICYSFCWNVSYYACKDCTLSAALPSHMRRCNIVTIVQAIVLAKYIANKWAFPLTAYSTIPMWFSLRWHALFLEGSLTGWVSHGLVLDVIIPYFLLLLVSRRNASTPSGHPPYKYSKLALHTQPTSYLNIRHAVMF